MEACASSPFCYTIYVCLKCNLSNYKYTIFWIKVNRIVTKKAEKSRGSALYTRCLPAQRQLSHLIFPNHIRKNNSLRHLSFYKMIFMEYNTSIEPI